MADPIQSVWDTTHTWLNANDRVAYQNMMGDQTAIRRKIAQAMVSGDPQTPDATLRGPRDKVKRPNNYGPGKPTLGIDSVLNNVPDRNILRGPTDFTGANGSFSGSSFPSLQVI